MVWTALVGLLGVVAIGGPVGATSPAAGSPTHVLADFNGDVKGLVQVAELPEGAARLSITLLGVPPGVTRIVGSTAPCRKALARTNRVFSLTLDKLDWVRRTVDGLLPGGVDPIRSLRLLRPGGSPAQVACRAARPFLDVTPAPVAAELAAGIKLENVLITSYSVVGRTRGQLEIGPAAEGKVRVRAVLQRVKPDVTYRIVGSTKPCDEAHLSADSVFSATVPASGWKWSDGGVEHEDTWDAQRSVRVFRGAGFARQEVCMGIIAVLIGL